MVLVLDTTPEIAVAVSDAAKPTLAGLGDEGLRAALAEIGIPEWAPEPLSHDRGK